MVRNDPESRVKAANSRLISTRPRNGPNTVQDQPSVSRRASGLFSTPTPSTPAFTMVSPPRSTPRGDFHHRVLRPFPDRARRAQDAPGHDRQPVADPEQFGEVGADHHDRLAL